MSRAISARVARLEREARSEPLVVRVLSFVGLRNEPGRITCADGRAWLRGDESAEAFRVRASAAATVPGGPAVYVLTEENRP